MNNKKLSKNILILTIIGMLIMGVAIIFANKTKIQVEDVSGDRSNIGNMNFILHARKGSYETDEIIINKDSEKINKRVKEGSDRSNLTKENIKNRDLLLNVAFPNNIFENEKEIGTADTSNIYFSDDNSQLTSKIHIKNKENNKIEEYEIPLGEKTNKVRNDMFITVPIKTDENTMYLSVLTALGSGSGNYKTTELSLYKINLEDKTSRVILSKEYDEKELSILVDFNGFGFAKDKKTYFLVNKKDEKSDKVSTQLLEFDVISKKVEFIDLGDYPFGGAYNYYIEGNEILLVNIPDGGDENLKATLVDLKNREVVYKHTLDLEYKSNEMGVLRVRRDDNKIYIAMTGYSYGTSMYFNYYMNVIDEKTNKNLYEGIIKLDNSYGLTGGIVKDDEL